MFYIMKELHKTLYRSKIFLFININFVQLHHLNERKFSDLILLSSSINVCNQFTFD